MMLVETQEERCNFDRSGEISGPSTTLRVTDIVFGMFLFCAFIAAQSEKRGVEIDEDSGISL